MNSKAAAMLTRLNAKSSNPEPTIAGTAPYQGIDWEAVAFAISKVRGFSYHYVIAMYTNDTDSARKAVDLFVPEVFDIGRQYQIEAHEAMSIGAGLIAMSIHPSLSRCQACNGRGEKIYRGVLQTCKVCEGTGKRKYSESAMAKSLGLDRHRYRNRKYGKLVAALKLKLDRVESEVLEYLGDRLFTDSTN